MRITDNTYVSLTTFRASGEAVPTPVWIVDLGNGRAGVTTAADSGKVKRLHRDPRVTLAPCDQRGRVEEGAVTVPGTATLADADEHQRIQAAVARKHPLASRLIGSAGRVRRLLGRTGTDRAGIAIELDDDQA